MTDDRTASGPSQDAGRSNRSDRLVTVDRTSRVTPDESLNEAGERLPIDSRSHAEFAGFHEGYVRHYITLADTKAAVIFGVASSLIAFLLAKKNVQDILATLPCGYKTVNVVIVAVLLTSGAAFAASVIAPRLSSSGEGLVYFGDVKKYLDSVSYAEMVERQGQGALARARLQHCYDISRVCWRKYVNLRRAFWLTLAGIVCTLPLLR